MQCHRLPQVHFYIVLRVFLYNAYYTLKYYALYFLLEETMVDMHNSHVSLYKMSIYNFIVHSTQTVLLKRC